MCGFPLRRPQPAVAQPARRADPPIAISSFSILGLQDGSIDGNMRVPLSGTSQSAHYLLEDDEPESSHRGIYTVLLVIVIVAAAGTLVWNWQQGGLTPTSQPSQTNRARSGPTSAATDAPTARNPADGEDSSANSAPAVPRQQIKIPPAAKPSPAPEPSADPSRDEIAASPAQNQDDSGARVAAVPTDAASQSPRRSLSKPSASLPRAEAPANSDEKSAADVSPSGNVVASKPLPAAAQPARAPIPSTDPQLFADGENYLYGNGVVRDCNRAQSDLRAAAGHSYPQAESLLGTMYASGHCVGRDLPMAYRWFARALHHDPSNTRIQSDLEVLWKQMTPPERQAAQRGQ
jgi:hypothetical protein